MKIKILGTRGEVDFSAPYHSKQSGVLINDKLLFDLGEQDFLNYHPKHIFITHLHPDHAFWVGYTRAQKVKLKARSIFKKISVPIFAPELDEFVDITKVTPKKPIKIGKARVTPLPTHHSVKVKSVAYLIKLSGSKVLYTGDIIWLNKKYHRYLESLDLVITDGSFLRKGGLVRRQPKTDKEKGKIYGHTGIRELIRLFKPFTKNILFIHFGSWFFKNVSAARKKLSKLGKENGVNVITGYDGMEIEADEL